MQQDGSLLLGSEPIPRNQVQTVMARVVASNPTANIYVKGDRRLKFKDVKTVLDDLHAAGAQRLALAASELRE